MNTKIIHMMPFCLYLLVFAVSLITIFLPTKTEIVNPQVEETVIFSQFSFKTLTYYPNYVIGLTVVSVLSLVGLILVRYLAAIKDIEAVKHEDV